MKATYVCILEYQFGITPLVRRDTNCPQNDQHEPEPVGYVEWHTWASLMSRTHSQRRCVGCGLYAMWVPRTPRPKSPPKPRGRPRKVRA